MNFSSFLTGWVLKPSVSTFGPQIDSIYYVILWITGIIFVLTEVALILFSIMYREKEGKKAHYTHGNTTVEIIWTTIPALLLVYMGITSQNLWSQMRQPSLFPSNPMVIKVLAEHWIWHFRYPGPDGQFGTPDDIIVDNSFPYSGGPTGPLRSHLAGRDPWILSARSARASGRCPGSYFLSMAPGEQTRLL